MFLFFFFFINFANAQTVTVTPLTQNINPGQNATVRITTNNIDKCTITGEPYNNFDIIKSGSILLKPNKTTEYTFNCKDKGGKVVTKKANIVLVPINIPNNTNVNNNTNTQNPGNNNPNNNSGNLNTGNSNLGQNNNTQNQQQPPRNNTQYSTQNLNVKANELCSKYSNYTSVYNAVTGGGGGGSVPVDLQNLAQYLIDIDRETKLVADEIRQQNIIKYCTEYQNMADASKRLGETAAKTIKTIADNYYANENKMREVVFKSSLEQEIKTACNDPQYPETLCDLVQQIGKPKKNLSLTEQSIQSQNKCNEYREQGFEAKECGMVPKAFEVIVDKYYAAENNIEIAQTDIGKAFSKSDVMGARPCIKTASNRPANEVRFYEADCIEYRQEPSIVNEEALRQITALPYTQAFSPSSVLGYDGVLDNINTRAREGNLVDSNISPNFGQGSNAGTGGTGGTGNGAADLAGIEANYKKISSNIGVIIQLYDVARLAYASSTSVCKNLPVITRREAVNRIDQNKKTYVDYLKGLKTLWDNAVAKPRESHSDLIVKVNFDLKDKYNQAEIDKVYDAVKKLLQTCVDAGGRAN